MKKKRGSILIYVMVIFAVLMIMGATLTTLTLQSMKNRKYYSNNRINLYYSESGIDEAYGIATEYVKAASDYAVNETNDEIERIMDEDKSNLEIIFHMREELNYTDEEIKQEMEAKNIILKLYNEFGELNKTKLKDKQNELFKGNYIGFFTLESEKNMNNLITDIKAAKAGEGIDVKVINEDVTPSEAFSINITSTFTKEGIEKIISANLKFTTPNYGSKISFPTKYTVFPESPIWNKGIVVNETLSIGKGKLEVIGDVYVKGKAEGAILLKSNESELNVGSGKVIACEGVKYDYSTETGKSAGAKVKIEDGNLYAKGILFGAQGAGLHLNDSVYVLDDCEINSKNSTLEVGDSYYGVSSGENAVNNKVDSSSSIIINSGDLGIGESTVTIGGKVYLAGTSYIRDLNNPAFNNEYDYAYQTGESISIKGNYKAYSENLKEDFLITNATLGDVDLKYELEKTMLSPLVLATHYNKYSKWFTIYGEEENKEIYFGMDNKLKEKYENMGWSNLYKIKVPELGDKEFQIGMKESLGSSEITIEDIDELTIKLIDEDGAEIELEKVIKVPKLQEDVEAFLLGDNKVFIKITPKGEMNTSFYEASDVEVEHKHGGFDRFIEIPNTTEGESVSVIIRNSNHIKTFEKDIKLLSYSTYFQSFDVFDKSKYFVQFYNDDVADNEEDIIHNGSGISIGDINNNYNESIYTGAIISEKGALSSNYSTQKDYSVRQKKAELKDKIFYMDMFENKNDGGNENELGDLSIVEYMALEEFETPERETAYQITPVNLLNIKKEDEVDSLDTTGLYISTAPKTVLTNKANSKLEGKKVKLNNNSYGIIICAGDVYLEGNFTFTGTIITLGNLFVVDDPDMVDHPGVKIYYDDALVKRVVAKNYDKLKNVFVNKLGYEFDKVKVEVYENKDENETNISEPLTIEKWAVVK